MLGGYASQVHPVFNPIAPYGYLLPNMYLYMADIANPDLLFVFVGPGFVSTSSAFMRSNAVCDCCDSSTACRLCCLQPYSDVVVVVGPTPPPKNGGGVQQLFLRTPANGIPHLAGIRARWLTGGPLHSTSRCPTCTGAVHKPVTFSCVFMLVQVNKCVIVYGSDLQRWHSGDGCLSSSIFSKYERSKGH